MTLPLRPKRGGFLRPFGAGIFIRDFLNGEGPRHGAPAIDPDVGAPQSDIHAAYKGALHLAMAEDAVALDAEEAIRRGKPLSQEEMEKRRLYYLERIPYKLCKMRYSSFTNYFARLIRLGWVEPTGETERSEPQDNWPGARPRVYYRLTDLGRAAPDEHWSDPLLPLYHYPREVRSPRKHRYFRHRSKNRQTSEKK